MNKELEIKDYEKFIYAKNVIKQIMDNVELICNCEDTSSIELEDLRTIVDRYTEALGCEITRLEAKKKLDIPLTTSEQYFLDNIMY